MAQDSDYEVSYQELFDYCEVRTTRKVSNRLVFDMLISAFEGGINYWCSDLDTAEGYDHITATKAFAMGSLDKIRLYDQEYERGTGRWVELTQERMRRGLRLMAKNSPRHFDNMFDDPDAETSDVLIQYAVFGKVVYG